MSVIDQLAKPAVNSYLCNKYNLTLQEICILISDHFAKKIKVMLLHCNTTTTIEIIPITKIN